MKAARAAEDTLEPTLLSAYNSWRNAVLRRDADGWNRYTTSRRRMSTRNMIISQKQPYPDAIFRVAIKPPPTTGLRLLEAQANGPTAHLAYFGKIDIGGGTAEVNEDIMILKFLREGDAWRFDSTRYMSLDATPEVREKLNRGEPPDFLEESPFTPPGVLPKTPPPCRAPEYVGGYDIQSFGYETGVKINGADYGKIANHDGKQIIVGGLNRGKNDLELSIDVLDIPKDAERFLRINVVVLTGNPKKPSIKVFTWDTQDDSPAKSVRLPVYVTSSTLEGR
jgi:hypothetical protein